MENACLERNPALLRAATYRRSVEASLARVWENVRDWEHLPWLHASSFAGIERLDSGPWGWRVSLRYPNGAQGEVELCIDLDARRYVARTLSGFGKGTEVWTTLNPQGGERTDIEVEFLLDVMPTADLARVGERYVALYTQLWDEDEAMMQQRECALRSAPPRPEAACVDLGSEVELRARLPLEVEVGGQPFCIASLGGELVVHAARCPHWGGPLGGALGRNGRIVCPWHGYAFDPRTGRSCDGRGLTLSLAPRLEADVHTGRVRLVAEPVD